MFITCVSLAAAQIVVNVCHSIVIVWLWYKVTGTPPDLTRKDPK